MTRETDQELVWFCHAEHLRVVGMLALHVGDRAIAEELAQDAFAKLCRHWPRVRSMRDRRAWLNRVAFNLANSALRRRYAEARANARHGATPTVDRPADTAATLAVREAVAALPRRQRQALVLRYFEGLSVSETAEQMRCAEGTVKSLTAKAIGALRERSGLLEDHEETMTHV